MSRKMGMTLQRRHQRMITFCTIIILAIVLMVGIDLKIRPVMKTLSTYQSKLVATQIIDQVVENELSNSLTQTTYDGIVILARDQNNQVTSLQIDMVKANRLKARITSGIQKELATIREKEMKIPLGTFTGNELLSGRGPGISFRVIPSGYVDTQFENHFESAGINQVLHQVILHVETNVTAIIPGYTTGAKVSTSFIVAQTLINGVVPDSFTQVEDGEIAKKIADYS